VIRCMVIELSREVDASYGMRYLFDIWEAMLRKRFRRKTKYMGLI